MIEPVVATVVGETYRYGVYDELKTEQVFAIAQSGNRWLLYRPLKREFSMAYGPSPDQLTIWGFSSADALAEWLG